VHAPQENTTAAVERLFSFGKDKYELWAWAVVESNLPFTIAKHSLYAAILDSIPAELRSKVRLDIPTAEQIRTAIAQLAIKLRQQIRHKFLGHPCLIAIDGGTLHRCTLLNFVVHSVRSRAALFVTSRRVDDCTAATIAAATREVRDYCRNAFGMCPVGVVTDNASAMARAAEDLDEDEVDLAAPFFTEDVDGEQIADDDDTRFFVHVRCWAHVWQLLIGDVAKKLPVAVEMLKRVLHIPRATRAKVAALRIQNGKSTTKIPTPAATRWNSQTRSAAAVIDFCGELIEAGVPISADDLTALKIFVVCTSPFAWATTLSQADNATLGEVRRLIPAVRENFLTIRNQAQEFPESIRNVVLHTVDHAEACLAQREAKYLSNVVTDALDQLESVAAVARIKWDALATLIRKYFETIGVTVEGLEEEFDTFAYRQDSERIQSDQEQYWERAVKRFPTIVKFRRELKSLVGTEASVERSFQREGEIWRAKRNRLSEAAVTDQLFVAINFPKLRLTADAVEVEPQRRRHHDDVPKETWARILSSLTDASVREPRPVRRTAARIIEQLKVGKRVEVLWRLHNGASVYYKGTIVGETRKNEYKIYWDNPDGGEQVTQFKPLTTDTEWRFVAE
jgi:hypothetical protein